MSCLRVVFGCWLGNRWRTVAILSVVVVAATFGAPDLTFRFGPLLNVRQTLPQPEDRDEDNSDLEEEPDKPQTNLPVQDFNTSDDPWVRTPACKLRYSFVINTDTVWRVIVIYNCCCLRLHLTVMF